MAEKEEKNKLIKVIKEHNSSFKHKIWYTKHYGSAFSRVGVPDFLLCYRGKFIAIEMKAPKKSPTKVQESTLCGIIEAGGIAAWFDSGKDAVEWLLNRVQNIDEIVDNG